MIPQINSALFTYENSARRNMQCEPFDFDLKGHKWTLNDGWTMIGWCRNPPMMSLKNKESSWYIYVGLMVEDPEGERYWWHWMLARGEESLTDWNDHEWPL